jgi:hypothetical protein
MSKSRKSKPFIDMEPQEFEDSLDRMAVDLDRKILEDGRKADSDIVLALAILDIPGVGSRIVTYDCEYGDGQGNRHIDDFVRICHKFKMLQPGETLRRVEWRAAVTAKNGIQ